MSGDTQEPVPRRRGIRREPVLLVVCILLLLLATIPPLVNLGRFQRRVAGAIGRSLGRPIRTGAISLRLLPLPAFEIENLLVAEDPAFGAEPALFAPEVVAEPRLSSLWRGRFELNRIELSDASVNLVRNADGRWSISSVLLLASHIPNAPTAQSRPGATPRFPYIEATGTRINFKHGSEKMPYSLLNADFSMSLVRPEVWQIQLEGQPVRTDLAIALSDTGLVRLEGEIHRASALGAMPLRLTGEWKHAPLGQLSRLLLGRDAGWRGDIDLTAQFAGEPDRLDVRTHLLIANLHRQEFTPQQEFTLDASCQAHLSRADADSAGGENDLHCRWPVGGGSWLLDSGGAASAQAPATASTGSLRLTADKVPAGFFASAVGLLQAGAPAAERFAGLVNGSFLYDPADGRLSGALTAPSVSFADAGPDGTAMTIQNLQLAAGASQASALQPSLLFSSKPVALGAPSVPMSLAAELSPRGYTLHARGGASLAALQAAADALRLPTLDRISALPTAPANAAAVQLALTASAPWNRNDGNGTGGSDLLLTNATGTVQLANVRWEPAWLPVPVDLASATATLAPGPLAPGPPPGPPPSTVRWTTPAALLGAGANRLRIAGNAQVPLHCESTACVTEFSLNLPVLDAGGLQSVLTGGEGQLLSSILNRLDATRLHLPAFHGSVHVGLLTLGRLPLRDVSATVATGQAPGDAIALEGLDAHTLGGSLHLQGAVSIGGGPRYRLQASAEGVSAAQAAALWHESWGQPGSEGSLDGAVDLQLQGSTADELRTSAQGRFRASWLHGDLPPALPAFASWDGAGFIDGHGLHLEHSTLPGTPATVSGTIGWDRGLALTLVPTPDAQGSAITGTLAAPVVQRGEPASP